MVQKLTEYEDQLLSSWEEVYKRGQLTLWIMLALYDGPKHMATIKEYVISQSSNTLSADDQSMYRALRRYYETEIVTYENQSVSNAPDRKVYKLTPTGKHLLEGFIKRNIRPLLDLPTIKRIGEE
jgi:PadR family transcriptional regulator PadR